MSYIGKTPTVGNFQVCDAISVVNNQAAYTMQVGSVNVLPESANHMIVSLNGVIQKPNSSYTVSGATITFASNLVTGDVINFIQILGSVLDLGVPSDDTVSTVKLQNDSVTTDKLANSINSAITANTAKTGITSSQASAIIANTAKVTNATHSGEVTGATALTIADNIVDEANLKVSNSPVNGYNLVARSGNTGGMTWEAAAGGTNTPNFRARVTADTNITNNTLVKVIFPTEDYDTASAYNTSNGRFTIPTGQGGKYFIYSQLFLNSGGNNLLKQARTVLYKNNSLLRSSENNYEENRLRRCSVLLSTVENLSAGDYLEIYAVCDSDSGNAQLYNTTGNPNYFGAFKIIE